MSKRLSRAASDRVRKRLRRSGDREDVSPSVDARPSNGDVQEGDTHQEGLQSDEFDPLADPEDVIRPNYSQPPRGGVNAPGRRLEQDAEVMSDPQKDKLDKSSVDDGGDDDEDEEQVEEEIRLTKDHGFASSGILKSIELYRFMNHDCFEFPFGPNVNIINGANGSGKSACVAALQLGLLARANATERGSRNEDHIMHGKDSALIAINILNRKPRNTDEAKSEPDMTYRHDVYGDLITIERRFVRGGAGGWAVKGKNKRHAKLPEGVTARKEVTNIVDHFGFMVSNPVAVLTQTKAKAFLAGSKPPELYKFYREATLLGPLEEELLSTTEITNDVSRILRARQESLPAAEKKLEKLAQEYENAQEMKNINNHIRAAHTVVAWTLVQEQEIALGDLKGKLTQELEPSKEQVCRRLNESQKKLDELSDEQAKHQRGLVEATEAAQLTMRSLKDIKTRAAKGDLDKKRYEDHLKRAEHEVKQLERKITMERKNMDRTRRDHFAGQEQKSQIIRDLKEVDVEMEALAAQVVESRERQSGYSNEKLEMEEKLRRIQGELGGLRRVYEEKRKEHLMAGNAARQKDSLGRFGEQISQLCARLHANERSFHRRPIGPVGQFVKLLDESWAPAVEMAIGRRTLHTFIVHDSHDAKTLERLMPRQGSRPMILIADLNCPRYEIRSQDMPDVHSRGHQTILDILRIQEDAVFNALVDQNQIERNVLHGGDGDITNLGWSRLANLHTVWDKRCQRAYTRNGSDTFRKGPRNPSARYLAKDMRQYLDDLVAEVEHRRHDLAKGEENARQFGAQLRGIEESISSISQNISRTRKREQDLQRRKSALDEQLNQAENAFDETPFTRAISMHEEGIQAEEGNKQRARAEIDAVEESEKENASKIETAKLANEQSKTEMRDARAALDAVHNKIGKEKSLNRTLKKRRDNVNQEVEKLLRGTEEQETKLTELVADARQLGDCPDNIDVKALSSDRAKLAVNRLVKKRETEQNRRGGMTAQEIEAAYLRAKKTDKENRERLARVLSYEAALTNGLQRRKEKLRELNKLLKRMVRGNFRQFMGTKGHSGSISFSRGSNGESELHIKTTMVNHSNHQTDDIRALSGGEKSFTTLALILSLAEICHNPVRVFDEIDVFQDEATRRTAYQVLIEFCNKYLSNRQIIILTPLKLPNIQPSPSVFIQKLRSPREDGDGRTQTRIDNYASTDPE